MDKKIHTLRFILADWFSAAGAWAVFFIYRKMFIELQPFNLATIVDDRKFFWGIIIIPVCWVLAYALSGNYQNVFRRSRFRELGQTLYISIIGVFIIFFSLLLDDAVISYKTYYHTFFTLLTLHFVITAILRFMLST